MKHPQILLMVSVWSLCVHGQQVNFTKVEGWGKKMLTSFATNEADRVTVYAGVVSAFRESAIERPKVAAQYHFEERACSRWRTKIESAMIDQQLSDFFTGAMMLSGSQNESGGIVGLYNPWWDAILLMQLNGNGIATSSVSAIKIVDWHWLSGETFRSEPKTPLDQVSTRTVVPETDPISVELWRVTEATRQVFCRAFPLESKPGWGGLGKILLQEDAAYELNRLQTRSALRLKFSLSLLKNSRDTGIALKLCGLARNGNLYELYKHFREPNARPLLQTLAEMPPMFRQDFTPYCYLPTPTGTLYVLINKKVPRLYITVSLQPNPTVLTSSLEWYDLLMSDKLLDAWNNKKEVAK